MSFKSLMKIFVNLITTSRLVFSVFLAFMHLKINKYKFLIAAILLFLTDFIDGILARKFKVQSYFGSTMDTIADKTLNIVLLLPLLSNNALAIIVLLEEVLIALMNAYGKFKGKHTRSSIIGKIKMWFLAISVILGYLYIFKSLPLFITNISFVLTIIIELYVIIEYYLYLKNQDSKKKTKKKITNYKKLIYILFSTKYYEENILTKD